jgi:hypothetical protein
VIRKPVVSTNVESVGYDESSRTLEIEFHDGSIYQYFDVPRNVFQELMTAASIGAYVNRELKGRFNYRQVA